MGRAVGMPNVVDAEEMSHDKVRIVLEEFGDEVGHNAVVHRVQVLDVERGVVEGFGQEAARVETQPRVVSHEGDVPPAGLGLVEEVVLQDLVTVEVAADVDERGEAAGRECLQALHRGGRGVRHQLEYLGVARLLSEKVSYEGHLVPVRGRRWVEGPVVDDEVVSQCVYE